MLYLDIENPAPLMVPRNREPFPANATTMQVRNTTDGQVLDLPVAACNLSGDYAVVTLGELPDGFHAGEWEYTLCGVNGEDVVTCAATGVLSVTGEPTREVKQYDANTETKQYGE